MCKRNACTVQGILRWGVDEEERRRRRRGMADGWMDRWMEVGRRDFWRTKIGVTLLG